MQIGLGLEMERRRGDPFLVPLLKRRTVVGRAPGSDIRIPLPSVAPRHCELHWDDGCLRVMSGGDAETLHNGRPIEDAPLEVGDELRIGTTRFFVRSLDVVVIKGRMPGPDNGR